MHILFQMDSEASVGAINNRGSIVLHFNEPVQRLMDVFRVLGCEVVARHLPSKQIVLADGISRLADRRDKSDLTLLLPPFTAISGAMRVFDVDACSNDLGNNSRYA